MDFSPAQYRVFCHVFETPQREIQAFWVYGDVHGILGNYLSSQICTHFYMTRLNGMKGIQQHVVEHNLKSVSQNFMEWLHRALPYNANANGKPPTQEYPLFYMFNNHIAHWTSIDIMKEMEHIVKHIQSISRSPKRKQTELPTTSKTNGRFTFEIIYEQVNPLQTLLLTSLMPAHVTPSWDIVGA